MNDAIRKFLANEERALAVFVDGSVGVMLLGLLVAVGMMYL